MATTPEEWLPILTERLDARLTRIALLRSYANGNPPLPEMGDNTRASWILFQKKAVTNYGGLAVEALANRITPNGITIGSDDANTAVLTARRIWRDNRMNITVAEAVRDYLVTSIGYLVNGVDSSGRAVITQVGS